MTQPIDEVYVDLHARGTQKAARDVERAAKEMQSDLNTATKNITRDIDTMSRNITIGISDATDDIKRDVRSATRDVSSIGTQLERVVRQAARDMEEALGDVADESGDTGEAIARNITVASQIAKRAIDDLADDATRDFNRMKREANDTGRSFMSSISSSVMSSITSAVNGLTGALSSLSSLGFIPLIAIVVAAMAAIVALGGAIADLSATALLLPGIIGSLVTIFAALKIATSGVGEAIEALASGDLEKIKAAMDGLAPSARAFAREVDALRKPFGELKKAVQEAFFAPLDGQLTRLAKAALPTLKTGLSSVSGALGNFGSQIMDLLGANDILEATGDIFETTANIINRLAPHATDLLGTLFGVAEHSLPFVERAANALNRGLDNITKFLSDAMKTGDFEKWLEQAFDVMSDLWDLTKSVFGLMKTLFGDTGDEGQSIIQSLTAMVDKLNEFFKSPEGQQGLQDSLNAVVAIFKGMVWVVDFIGDLIGAWVSFYHGIETAANAIGTAGKAVGNFFVMLGGWAVTAWNAVTGFFSMLGGFFVSVGEQAVVLWNNVKTFFGNVVTFITELPGKIAAGISALPGIIGNMMQNLFDQVTYAIGFGLGTLIKFFMDLPDNVMDALSAFTALIAMTFTRTKEWIINTVTAAVNATVTFFANLPKRVSAAVSSLIRTVADIFTRTRDGATSRASSMMTSVVNYFKTLRDRVTQYIRDIPGRVVSTFNSVVRNASSIGRSIMQGIVNGISNGIGWVRDYARRAAYNILQGMKNALGIGSPSKVFADEVGRWIPSGIAVGINDNVQVALSAVRKISNPLVTAAREILSAMGRGVRIEEDLSFQGMSSTVSQWNDKLADMLKYAGGFSQNQVSSELQQFLNSATGSANAVQSVTSNASTGITFDTGAIQIIFQGAVPTRDEALQTGEAVAAGIAGTLARRSIRTAARVS